MAPSVRLVWPALLLVVYQVYATTNLDDLHYYELIDVEPSEPTKRSIAGKALHDEVRELSFNGHGKNFKLNLKRNDYLFPQTFTTYYQKDTAEEAYDADSTKPENCHYQGIVVYLICCFP